MTYSDDKRTYIDPASSGSDPQWVTEDSGRTREATQEEIEETVEKWESDAKAGDEDARR